LHRNVASGHRAGAARTTILGRHYRDVRSSEACSSPPTSTPSSSPEVARGDASRRFDGPSPTQAFGADSRLRVPTAPASSDVNATAAAATLLAQPVEHPARVRASQLGPPVASSRIYAPWGCAIVLQPMNARRALKARSIPNRPHPTSDFPKTALWGLSPSTARSVGAIPRRAKVGRQGDAARSSATPSCSFHRRRTQCLAIVSCDRRRRIVLTKPRLLVRPPPGPANADTRARRRGRRPGSLSFPKALRSLDSDLTRVRSHPTGIWTSV